MDLIIFIVLLIAGHVGLYKVFEKAGEQGWKALVPIYNLVVWNDLIGRKRLRLLLLLLPLVNFFIFAAMLIELAKSFDKHDFLDHVYAVALAPLYLLWLGFTSEKKVKYVGQGYLIEKQNPIKKSTAREWAEAIIFAVFAATFIRMFLIEAYTIPTPSMESSLLVGDFLFVSKINYGSRAPMTPIQFPLVHNTIPLTKKESYVEWIKWPYWRLNGFETIERFDPVVFNFPEGDTIVVPQKKVFDYGTNNYYTLKHLYRTQVSDPTTILHNASNYKIITRPIDKRDNYIKRCIGLPGEELQIKNHVVSINGKEIQNPPNVQFSYEIVNEGGTINPRALKKMGITDQSRTELDGVFHLNDKQVEELQSFSSVKSVTKRILPSGGRMFPDNAYGWTVDNFGPINIPKKGEVVNLTLENLPLYRRIISVYENNTLEVKDGKILINGEETSTYTVKMDYYFMMGDNRHNSEDSRVWGFVPHDHIVGKPLFIWFSRSSSGVRWKRIFRGANDM